MTSSSGSAPGPEAPHKYPARCRAYDSHVEIDPPACHRWLFSPVASPGFNPRRGTRTRTNQHLVRERDPMTTDTFGFRDVENSAETTDAARVADALDTLVRFAHRTRDKRPYYAQPTDARGTRWGGSDRHRAIEAIVDTLGHGDGVKAVERCLDDVVDDERNHRAILANLDTVEESYNRWQRRKAANARRPPAETTTVTDAIDTVRSVLEDDGDREPTFQFTDS